MSRYLDRHEDVLLLSVEALAYAKHKAKSTDNDIPNDTLLALGKLEHKASEQNVMFCLYNQVKNEHRVRLSNSQLKNLTNSGSLSMDGIDISYQRETMSAFINNGPVFVTPLLKAGEKPKGSDQITHSRQRKTYLLESIVNQRAFVDYDSLGHFDIFGNDVNTTLNKRKASEALREMEHDSEDVNPNAVFKTDLTASQKMRVLLSGINTHKVKIIDNYNKLTQMETDQVKDATLQAHIASMAKALSDGTISPIDALKANQEQVFNKDHHYFKTTMQEVKGLNNTSVFPMSHLKEIPKGYKIYSEVLDKHLAPNYGKQDSALVSLAKQFEVFENTAKQLPQSLEVDFKSGVDIDRFMVITHKIDNGAIKESKPAVMNSNEVFGSVKKSNFGLPSKNLTLKKIKDYDLIILAKGPSASGAFQKAVNEHPELKDKAIVFDVLTDRNTTSVLSDIREVSRIPVIVYTDNTDLDNYIKRSNDNRVVSRVSQGLAWGATAIKSIQNDSFDKFKSNTYEDLRIALSREDKDNNHSLLSMNNPATKSKISENNTTENINPDKPFTPKGLR